jgi:hypothetical protein
MCKKTAYLICFILALGLAITNIANAQDPNLVGWWKLDEASGTTARDSSGFGNNGTLNNGPTWVTGRIGDALDFDGTDDYVDCGDDESLNITGNITLSLWVNTDTVASGTHRSYLLKGDTSYALKQNSWGNIEFFVYIGGWQAVTLPADESFNGVWHHLAGTYDGSQIKLYVDGILRDTKNYTGAIGTNTAIVSIGSDSGTRRYCDARIDDVRIYNRAITAMEVIKLAAPEKASSPSPANDSIIRQTEVILQWDAGIDAVSHNVYFSEDEQAVIDGTADVNTVSQTSFGPLSLDLGVTYFWRIDEVEADGSVTTGEVWNFTVQPLIAYNPSPSNGAKYVDPNTDLAWDPGKNAQSHDIYFGTDETAVANADTSSPEFQNNQTELTFELPSLEYNKRYYWRIDEQNNDATVSTGDVWMFKTIPATPITDPSLVGWWKLDDLEGKVALDWSGLGNNGTVVGDPQWINGQLDGALDLDGFDDCVDCGNPEVLDINEAISLLAWIRPDAAANGADQSYVTKGNNSYSLRHSNINNVEFRITETIAASTSIDGSFNGEWQHLAGTYNGSRLALYINGALRATSNSAGPIASNEYNVNIGRESVGNRFLYDGAIDDVRIYNRALTEDEIAQIMRGDVLLAWNPMPTVGSVMDIKHFVPLSWSPGDQAVEHDVYLGTNRDDVEAADTSTPDIYRDRQSGTSYNPPEGVEWGQNYFWRIDEINNDGTISTGRIWSFTIADYLVVEDFEDYNDYPPDEVWNTWLDGYGDPTNGSTAGYGMPDFVAGEHYLESAIVHSGGWSMPLFYDNNVGISEVTRTFAPTQDWTEYDVETLTLFYYGDPNNAPEPMFIIVDNAVITNDDANAALVTEWTQWDIPLQRLADDGVNLNNVRSMTIGFGNPDNPVAGGSGFVFFDDIRLYRMEPTEP